jgi:hypothetical protein
MGLGRIPRISGAMTSFSDCRIAFHARDIGCQVGIWNYIKWVDQFKNLGCKKIALIKALPMQMTQNIYIPHSVCEINDVTYIVDLARADGYKKGTEPRLVLSQLEDFKEASAPVKRTRRTRSWAHYPL